MTSRFFLPLAAVLGAGLLLLGNVSAQPDDDSIPPPLPTRPGAEQPPLPPTPEAPDQDVQVMARGPVHEAYAEPTETQPVPSPLVAKQPPDPIQEMPPDQKPEGDNVQWIPGYWAWDADHNDFLWVSGFWRAIPPGRKWAPGHWQEVEGGWHWVAGFWATEDQDEVEYLPPPPPSLEYGPSLPAPDDNSVYCPGTWYFRQQRYWWRPGYWCRARPDWVWIPAHFIWTPVGCVFVEGYWDQPLHLRGLLFAPVRIARTLLVEERFTYTPAYVVQPDFLIGALFVHKRNCHYYFGDYFEDRYRRTFVPWCDYRVNPRVRVSYDPNFAYYRHVFARHEGWERGLQHLYEARYSGDIPRPPRTLVQQTQVVKNITVNNIQNVTVTRNINLTNVQNVTVLRPLTQVNNIRITNLAALANGRNVSRTDVTNTTIRNVNVTNQVVRLEPVPRSLRVQAQKVAVQYHDAARENSRVEARLLSQGAIPVRPTDSPHRAALALPQAPALASRPAPSGAVRVPPPPPRAPRHEERPIPRHEPPRPPAPPSHPVTPPARLTTPLAPGHENPPSRATTPAPRYETLPPRRVTPPPTERPTPPSHTTPLRPEPRNETPPPRRVTPPSTPRNETLPPPSRGTPLRPEPRDENPAPRRIAPPAAPRPQPQAPPPSRATAPPPAPRNDTPPPRRVSPPPAPRSEPPRTPPPSRTPPPAPRPATPPPHQATPPPPSRSEPPSRTPPSREPRRDNPPPSRGATLGLLTTVALLQQVVVPPPTDKQGAPTVKGVPPTPRVPLPPTPPTPHAPVPPTPRSVLPVAQVAPVTPPPPVPPVTPVTPPPGINPPTDSHQLTTPGTLRTMTTPGSRPLPPPPPLPPREESRAAHGATVSVGVYDNYFQPATIQVSPGTTVRWINHGTHPHTVTAADGHWDSGELGLRGTYSITFSQPGTYSYYCSVHPKQMVGTVVVESGGSSGSGRGTGSSGSSGY